MDKPKPQGSDQTTEEASATPARARRRVRPEVQVALIEHGIRPAVLLVVAIVLAFWLFQVKQPLLDLLTEAQRLKIGWFEVELRASAAAANLSRELEALGCLNDEQLQLFLIIGKRRQADSGIDYTGEEVTETNIVRLAELGLLAEWRKEPDGRLWWRVSESGHQLHDIVRGVITPSIRRSAAATSLTATAPAAE